MGQSCHCFFRKLIRNCTTALAGHRAAILFNLTLFVSLIIFLAIIILFIYLLYLLIKALKKYIKSEPVRKERVERKKTLGEVIKKHRVDCKMTQEFVAETIGVSRQAVSKWENGVSQTKGY
ncbi:MAG: helix-turn-helix transcriptional regulator [Blautia producta]